MILNRPNLAKVATTGQYSDLMGAPSAFIPPGALLPYMGSAVPAGYLLANGAAVSRQAYAALFAAIGTLYGAGNGSTKTAQVAALRSAYQAMVQQPVSSTTAAGHQGLFPCDADSLCHLQALLAACAQSQTFAPNLWLDAGGLPVTPFTCGRRRPRISREERGARDAGMREDATLSS